MVFSRQLGEPLFRFLVGARRRVVWLRLPRRGGGARFTRQRAAHLRLGRRGEILAQKLLSRLGLDILACNVRSERGEVDIVARDDITLCFVEVKTRRQRRGSRPADAVTPRKQRRIIRAAHSYLHELGWPDVSYRYDIVEIVVAGRRLVDVRHWPGAFTEEPLAFADVMPRVENLAGAE